MEACEDLVSVHHLLVRARRKTTGVGLRPRLCRLSPGQGYAVSGWAGGVREGFLFHQEDILGGRRVARCPEPAAFPHGEVVARQVGFWEPHACVLPSLEALQLACPLACSCSSLLVFFCLAPYFIVCGRGQDAECATCLHTVPRGSSHSPFCMVSYALLG